MNRIALLSLLLSVASTANAFLPGLSRASTRIFQSRKQEEIDPKVVRIPLGKKERYVRKEPTNQEPTSLAQLEKEYNELKNQLRHDLFQLKHTQVQVAQEEDTLLEEALYEIELIREAQELSVMAAEEDTQYAHRAVEQAKKNQGIAAKQFAKSQEAWLESQRKDLQSLVTLAKSQEVVKHRSDVLKASQEVERHAQKRQRHAEELLTFLDEQQTALQEILQDPQQEHMWAQEELTNHHQSLLKVASLERETEKLWNQLRKDLLLLKRQQLQALKEEALLAAKEAEIVALQTQEQKEQVHVILQEMKRTHLQVKEAVAKKEKAYQDTLLAIEKGDSDPKELWMLAEAANESNEAIEVADKVKEKLTRLVAREAQAENLLLLLEQKAKVLKDLRVPGHERALEKWVEEELLDHESMLDVVNDNILLDS